MRAATASSARACACDSSWPTLYVHLEDAIHDQIMQSLGVSMLEVDLCRQLFKAGQSEQALEELDAITEALRSAVDVLRHVLGDLALAASRSRE